MNSENINKGFSEIIKIIRSKFKIQNAIIRKLSGDELITVTYLGYNREEADIIIKIGEGITGKCAELKKTIVVNDISSYDGSYIKGIENAKSEICLPIMSKDQLLGTLNIESSTKGAFDADSIKLLEKTAGVFQYIFTGYDKIAINLAKSLVLLNTGTV